MIDRCRLSVKGAGRGASNGRPASDKEGPVREFIKNNSYYFRLVERHLRECGSCDPGEVLRAYLEGREAPHLGGQVSGELMDMCLRFRKRDPGRVPESLVKEYVSRTMESSPKSFLRHGMVLSEGDVLSAFRREFSLWRVRSAKDWSRRSSLDQAAPVRSYRPLDSLQEELERRGSGGEHARLALGLCLAFCRPVVARLNLAEQLVLPELPASDRELMDSATVFLVMRS